MDFYLTQYDKASLLLKQLSIKQMIWIQPDEIL